MLCQALRPAAELKMAMNGKVSMLATNASRQLTALDNFCVLMKHPFWEKRRKRLDSG